MSRTYILTDTINESFGEIFSESLKGTDVAITAKHRHRERRLRPPAFDAALLPRVRARRGRRGGGRLGLLDRQVRQGGRRALTDNFAPNFIVAAAAALRDARLRRGPQAAHGTEASIDTQTADNGGLEIGDQLRVAGAREVKAYDVVGLTQLGDSNFGGAGIAQMTLPEAQRVTDRVGKFDQISVSAAEGVSAAELRDRIAEILPPNLIAETGNRRRSASRTTSPATWGSCA